MRQVVSKYNIQQYCYILTKMIKHLILIILIILVIIIPASAARWECVRWTWTGDVYNRKVVCLEWRDKDASTKIEKK